MPKTPKYSCPTQWWRPPSLHARLTSRILHWRVRRSREILVRSLAIFLFLFKIWCAQEVELPTNWLESSYSIQLSYGRILSLLLHLLLLFLKSKLRSPMLVHGSNLMRELPMLCAISAFTRLLMARGFHLNRGMVNFMTSFQKRLSFNQGSFWFFKPGERSMQFGDLLPSKCEGHAPPELQSLILEFFQLHEGQYLLRGDFHEHSHHFTKNISQMSPVPIPQKDRIEDDHFPIFPNQKCPAIIAPTLPKISENTWR